MLAGNLLEFFQPRELCLIRLSVGKMPAIDNFNSAVTAGRVGSCQPHFAIRPLANATKQLVVGNGRPVQHARGISRTHRLDLRGGATGQGDGPDSMPARSAHSVMAATLRTGP